MTPTATTASTQTRTLPVRNPRTGKIDFHMNVASAEEVAAICARLRTNQSAWGGASIEHRVSVMLQWAERLKANRKELIEADSIDTGYGQISKVAPDMVIGSIMRGCATAPAIFKQARRTGMVPGMPHIQFDTNFRPYALVGVIGPWNAPLMLSTLHAISPLFAGCAVIVKPSEVTPRFVKPMMETIREVPELAGVLTFVLGDAETGKAVVDSVDIVNFTGSVPNGRKVAEACARRFIPAILELGGKDPVIITRTADLEKAADAVIRGAVTSTGQVCFSIERIYIQEEVHDAFVDILIKKANEIGLNYPDPETGQLGPFIFERQAAIVDEHIDDALAKGAKIQTGGKSQNLGGGLYMRPTVLTGVNHEMKIMKDETFGPVMPVMKYRTTDEAVRLANDSYYGLSAAVIAGSDEEARRIGDRLDAGNVSVQDTFLTFASFAAGIEPDSFNYSGIGRGRPGMLAFVRKQGVLINAAAPASLASEGIKSV